MTARLRTALVFPLLSLVVGLGAASAEENSLERLRSQYSRIKSVHVSVSANVRRRADDPTRPPLQGSVKLEYWANEHGFRVSCSSSRSLELLDDREWAFDGSLWQLLQVEDRKLGLTAHGAQMYPVACPNPLFLMIQFIAKRESNCVGPCVDLPDLWQGGPLNYVRRPLSGGADQYSVTFGDSHQFDVIVDSGRRDVRPLGLAVFHPSGRKATNITATQFTQTVAGPLPTRMTGQSFADADDARSSWLDKWDFEISELEINRPVDERLFELDWASADMVFDADARRFVVHPHLYEMNEAIRLHELRPAGPPSHP